MKKNICCLMFILALIMGPACRTNPVTGRRELILVSEQQELELGREYHPSLVMMYDGEYIGDEELERYLDAVVRRIHSVSHRRTMPVIFTLLNTSMVNAFALPGHVYATRGLVVKLESEAQFAAVMAHEMGHVAAVHTAQRMTRQIVTELGFGLGGLALEDVRGARGILLAGQVGTILSGLSYSRAQERQADRLSAYYMAQAGWNPEAAIEVQKILGELAEGRETVLDKYLSTHPPTGERIADLRGMIDSGDIPLHRVEGDGMFAGRWADRTENIARVHRAYVKYDDATRALDEHKIEKSLEILDKAIQMQPRQAPFYRLKGDIAMERENLPEARQAFSRALDLYPDYAHAAIGLGQVALIKEQYGAAERKFASASDLFPASLTASHGLGVARFKQGKYAEAAAPLRVVSESIPRNPDVAYMLAVCYDRTGRYGSAHEAYLRAVRNGLREPELSRALARKKALAN